MRKGSSREDREKINRIKASEALNALCGMPDYRKVSVERQVLREIMLDTCGTLMAQGIMWNIKSKHPWIFHKRNRSRSCLR